MSIRLPNSTHIRVINSSNRDTFSLNDHTYVPRPCRLGSLSCRLSLRFTIRRLRGVGEDGVEGGFFFVLTFDRFVVLHDSRPSANCATVLQEILNSEKLRPVNYRALRLTKVGPTAHYAHFKGF